MKFSIDRYQLEQAVAQTARTLPARPVHPLLSGIKLHASPGSGLQVSAYDYEVSAQCGVPAEIAAEGTAVVPGRLLAEITRNLPARPAEVSVDETRMTLRCGAATFSLTLLPAPDYPELPALPPFAGAIGADLLAAAVAQVATAAARDDTLPVLTAILVQVNGEQLTLTATDRYRLAIRELTWTPARPDMTASVLIPAKTFTEVTRGTVMVAQIALHLDADTAGAAASPENPSLAGFEAGDRRITTRLLEGEYPNARKLIPAEFSCVAEIPAEPFTDALKRVALVAEHNTPVRLAFAGGQVTLEAGFGDEAQASEEVDAKLDGSPEFKVNFNAGYLADGVAAARADTIKIAMTTPIRPAVITSTDPDAGFRYLLMPVRTAG